MDEVGEGKGAHRVQGKERKGGKGSGRDDEITAESGRTGKSGRDAVAEPERRLNMADVPPR